MKTLYVSDLDGTLLRSDAKTSAYTNQILNTLTEKGMLFSYATARSLMTAKKVTKGINEFLATRKGDIRSNRVETKEALKNGNIFYITCIDEAEKLKPMYDKYKEVFHVVYAEDIYSKR